jgi:hypothetical protein
MYIEIMDKKPQPKASELARRLNLTSKTACNFKQKVILEFGFMELESKRIIFIFHIINPPPLYRSGVFIFYKIHELHPALSFALLYHNETV